MVMSPGFYAGVGLIDLDLAEKKTIFSNGADPVRERSS
jgi:hypothetical protein